MTAKASSLMGSPIYPVVSQAEKRNSLPWARVVKGEAEEAMPLPMSPPPPPPPFPETAKDQPISPDSSSSSSNNNGNAGSPKKPPAWNNKHFNGVVTPSPPVIAGATSWPALSESARSVSKSILDSSKTVQNQQPVSTSKEPTVISNVPRKQVNTNRSFNNSASTNKAIDNRQRPSRHNSVNHGDRNVKSGYDWQRPPPPPQSPSQQLSYFGVPSPRPPFGFPMVDTSSHNWDGGRPVGGGGGGVVPKQSLALVDQSSQRNSSRKGNFGSHSHIDSNQVRHDPDRNRTAAAQGSNFRDNHGIRQAVPFRGFMGPPPPPPMAALPFPQPLSPYGTPLGFASPILYYPPVEHYIYTPFIGHAPPPLPSQMQMYITPPVDPSLKASLVTQIHYYFSNANLDNDKYLKSFMDDQGWVPITLIAGFPKVKAMTQDINVVLNSLNDSTVVEIQGDKIRRRDEWMNWIPHSGEANSETGSDSKPPAISVDNTITTSDPKD